MHVMISQKETIISYIAAFAFILTMVTTSVVRNDHEIILPELAAMAIAMWVYREAGWIRQPSKIFIVPSITAAIGFAINQLSITYLEKVILTVVLIMLFLRLVKSNLAPSIATGLLPLVMNANEWTFILSVCIFTLILMLGVLVFKLNKGLERGVMIQYKYMLVFIMLIFVWITLCWFAGYPQLSVIPPVLVVVYEVLQKPMYNGKIAFKQGLVLTISATVGTLLYFVIDLRIVVTLLDMTLMLILLRLVGIRMPAVYAFPLLPFVFPRDIAAMLPPVGTLVASVFFFSSVFAYKKLEMKKHAKLMRL